jgi:hypothetical protein
LRHTFKDQLGPRTGDRHYIRVLQLLMRHPAARIDRAIGMLIHKPAITAEQIALLVDRLAQGSNVESGNVPSINVQCDNSASNNNEESTTDLQQQNEAVLR